MPGRQKAITPVVTAELSEAQISTPEITIESADS